MTKDKGCEHCLDPDGDNVYPYYGLRPHGHDLSKTGSFIGSTVFDDGPLPDNFEPDKETDGQCGTYTHCPHCGNKKEFS